MMYFELKYIKKDSSFFFVGVVFFLRLKCTMMLFHNLKKMKEIYLSTYGFVMGIGSVSYFANYFPIVNEIILKSLESSAHRH